MKTKAKILVSVIAICVLIAVVVLGLVLALTEPVHIVDNCNMVVNYSAGSVSAGVKITREDKRLYKSQGEGNSVTTDIGAEHNFACTLSSTTGTSGSLDLGQFNSGQLIDKTKADTALIIDISLNSIENSAPTHVSLSYADVAETDSNVKLVVSAVMYRGTEELDLGVTTFYRINDSWNITGGVLFRTNNPLSKEVGSNNYTGIRITVVSELVSFDSYGRLDGEFKLSLTA